MKTDLQLQRDVLEELKFEPSIREAEIGVAALGPSERRDIEQLVEARTAARNLIHTLHASRMPGQARPAVTVWQRGHATT